MNRLQIGLISTKPRSDTSGRAGHPTITELRDESFRDRKSEDSCALAGEGVGRRFGLGERRG
jgi:hypothetical protein